MTRLLVALFFVLVASTTLAQMPPSYWSPMVPGGPSPIVSVGSSIPGPLFSIINNYQPGASSLISTTQVSHYDTDGNVIDAHAGNLLQVGGTFYLYGESHACGFTPGTGGNPWCGVKVYSSTDLRIWTYRGYLFDGSTGTWQTNCATTNNGYSGCYSPKMLYNAANNNYVLWIYGADNSGDGTFYVFTCTSPTGGATPTMPGTGCTQQANATMPTSQAEAPSFYVDGSGNGYAAYTDLGNSYSVRVVALNSAFTSTTGSPTATGQSGEGNFIFQQGGNFVGFGSMGCAYCDTAATVVVSATSPLGTYGSPTTIRSDSCQGQPRDASVLTTLGTPVLYMSDQWWAQGGGGRWNQGFANIYFQPLTVTAGVVQPFSCSAQVQINGLSGGSFQSPGDPDQTDFGDVFLNYCDIASGLWRMQTFVPTRSTVASVSLPLAKNNASCAVASACSDPNGSVTVSLVTLDGSNNPVTTLASQNIPVASLMWAPQWTNVTFNQTVTPGTAYGIVLSSNTTTGCIGTAFNTAGSAPYPTGVERVSTNSGGSWTTEASRSLMFSSY